MKYPKLEQYPFEVIIMLMEDATSTEFLKRAEEVAMDKIIRKEIPSIKLVMDFQKSRGIKRRLLGNALVLRIIGMPVVNVSLVRELVKVVDIDYLFMLSTNGNSEFVRELARRTIDLRISAPIEDEELVAGLEAKMALDAGDMENYEKKLKYESRLNHEKYQGR